MENNFNKFGFGDLSEALVQHSAEPDLGHLGALKSHLSVASNYLAYSKAPFLLVLEDDFRWSIDRLNFASYLAELISLQRNLGWNVWQLDVLYDVGVRTGVRLADGTEVLRFLRVRGLAAYLCRREFVDELIAKWSLGVFLMESNRRILKLLAKKAREGSREARRRYNWLIDRAAVDNVIGDLQMAGHYIGLTLQVGAQDRSYPSSIALGG